MGIQAMNNEFEPVYNNMAMDWEKPQNTHCSQCLVKIQTAGGTENNAHLHCQSTEEEEATWEATEWIHGR